MESDTILIIDDYSRAVAQVPILSKLYEFVVETGLGHIEPPPVRISSRSAGFTTQPDMVAIFWETVEKERVQVSKTHRGTKPMLVIDGCPDLVVEIVSEGPERNLPHVYAPAGIPEVWIVDLRGEEPRLEIHAFHNGRYELNPRDAEGWTRSPLLDRSFRLISKYRPSGRRTYKLEDRTI
jgi:Uma2 family endonuclease